MGFRPIILERGKVVRERTKDTWGLWRRSVLNPESNVQFGEGGAGLFSDGKLHSQIKDPRHHGRKVLTEFVAAGAPPEILTVGKPHIGTFRLVTIVESMRRTIEALGGEYRFESRLEDIEIDMGSDGLRRVRGVMLADGTHIAADHVVLAVGHSARDTFQMLWDRGVAIEAKPFSIGVRIEHPQSLIDRCRFGANAAAGAGHPALGAADYKLVHHCANGRSVYTFCMCPGGTVVAAASEPGRVVTNGMSQYSRNERNANAGIVVGITPADYPGHPLAGIAFQRLWEERAFAAGGADYAAPAQLVGDFLAMKASTALGDVIASYKPGGAHGRSRRLPAGIRGRGDPRGDCELRPPDQGLCHGRRGDDGGRDPDLVADQDRPRRHLAEHQYARPLSRRRGGGLCRRHSLRRRRRHPHRGSRGAEHGRGGCGARRRVVIAGAHGSRHRFWARWKYFKSGGGWFFWVGISKPSKLSM